MYNLQTGTHTQWLEYEQLIDHLDLVIQYEKERKHHRQRTGGINRDNRELKIEIQEEDQEEGTP